MFLVFQLLSEKEKEPENVSCAALQADNEI